MRNRRCVRTTPLPIIPKLTIHRYSLGLEVEHPPCDEATQDGHVGDDDGYIVLDMVYAVVDRISPVSLERGEESVAVCEIDFSCADTGNAV